MDFIIALLLSLGAIFGGEDSNYSTTDDGQFITITNADGESTTYGINEFDDTDEAIVDWVLIEL